MNVFGPPYVYIAYVPLEDVLTMYKEVVLTPVVLIFRQCKVKATCLYNMLQWGGGGTTLAPSLSLIFLVLIS